MVLIFEFPNLMLILWGTLLLTSALNYGINFQKMSSWAELLGAWLALTIG